MNRQIWCLFGATASGKSEMAMSLAANHPLEIVCMDAFQVYQNIPILSAAPDSEDVKKVPHHGFAILRPDQSFSVVEWYERTVATICAIWERQKIPLLVGGTGLYLKLIQAGLEETGAAINSELRQDLEAKGLKNGSLWLWDELKRVWPKRADELHFNDKKRVIRALEIFYSPNSSQRGQIRDELAIFCPEWKKIWLNPNRDLLYHRINQRVLLMETRGLVEEVKNLQNSYTVHGTISQAIGYKETLGFLAGTHSREAWIQWIQQNTRRFAKRQLTWFRAQKDVWECSSVSDIAPWCSPKTV